MPKQALHFARRRLHRLQILCIAPGLQSQGSPLEDPLCLAEEKLPEGCLHFALLPSVSNKDARFKILQGVY